MNTMDETTRRQSIEQELREAQAHATAIAKPMNDRVAEQRGLIERADRAAAEAADVEGRRQGLLLPAARGDATAGALLEQLTPHVAALRTHERDLRDAAALLQPDIDAHRHDVQAAARAIPLLQHQLVVETKIEAAAAVRAALAALWPLELAYRAAAEAERISHVHTYPDRSAPYSGAESPLFCAARFLKVEAQKHFGVPGYLALGLVFPESAGTL